MFATCLVQIEFVVGDSPKEYTRQRLGDGFPAYGNTIGDGYPVNYTHPKGGGYGGGQSPREEPRINKKVMTCSY